MKLARSLLLVLVCTGCGYRPLYSGTPPSARLSVSSATHLTGEAEAVDGVLGAVKATLSRDGVLAGGAGHPRLVVEVLRVDEQARGLVARSEAEGGDVTSRGATVGVTARAWVIEQPGAAPTRDTGDVRRVVTYAHQPEAAADAIARAAAVRDAAARTGAALAERILGRAEPAVEDL